MDGGFLQWKVESMEGGEGPVLPMSSHLPLSSVVLREINFSPAMKLPAAVVVALKSTYILNCARRY